MHVAYLQKLLSESDWLRSAGVADQIVAKQHTARAAKEAELKKEQEAAKRRAAQAAESRRQEESIGMMLADRESKAYEDFYDEWCRLEEEKRVAEEKRKLNARRLAMIREDEASKKVEDTFRAYLIEKERQRRLAKERDERARERAAMTDAAKDCRYWNDMWNIQDEKLRNLNARVAASELPQMEEEEEHSTVMNRVWRRVGRAHVYTRAFLREKARREAAGLPAAHAAPPSAAHEDVATAEREAVREFFIELGVLKPVEPEHHVVSAHAHPHPHPHAHDGDRVYDEDGNEFFDVDEEGHGGDGAEDDYEAGYDGEVERGRNGWVALTTEEGYLYYCNDDTGETQWERPEDM